MENLATSPVEKIRSSEAVSAETEIKSRRISSTPGDVSKASIVTIHSPAGTCAVHLPSLSVKWDIIQPLSTLISLTSCSASEPPLSLVKVMLILHSGSNPIERSTDPPFRLMSNSGSPVMILVPNGSPASASEVSTSILYEPGSRDNSATPSETHSLPFARTSYRTSVLSVLTILNG